jgi:GNAT superfamily N-acetyltransferase
VSALFRAGLEGYGEPGGHRDSGKGWLGISDWAMKVAQGSFVSSTLNSDMANPADSYSTEEGHAFFVAVMDNSTVVGCVGAMRRSQTTVELQRMSVSGAHRGHRIGSQLVSAVETFAASTAGAEWEGERLPQSVVLSTLWQMHTAVALYQSCGYTITGLEVPWVGFLAAPFIGWKPVGVSFSKALVTAPGQQLARLTNGMRSKL